MSIDSDDGFVVARTAEEAVDRLAELHRQATAALSQALKRYIKERIEPSEAERQNFHYPQLRIGYRCQGEVPSTTRAYAKVQVPGEYSVTVTHPDAFRKYLLEQLRPLMDDFTVQVQVGPSQQDIPYPYVVEQGDELAGSGVTAAELARVFPSTDLSAASDDIADGLYEWERADQLPLALFDAARVDFSLRRLVHYTGSDWRHVQPWILLTNYHRYVDQFIRLGLTRLREDPRFVRMVLPGNVIIERGMDEGEANAIVAGVVWHRYQMPAYHLIAADGDGITLVNIGVGPSNAKNITDHLAVLRPHCWLMIGTAAACGSRRPSATTYWRTLHAPRRHPRPRAAAAHPDPGAGRSPGRLAGSRRRSHRRARRVAQATLAHRHRAHLRRPQLGAALGPGAATDQPGAGHRGGHGERHHRRPGLPPAGAYGTLLCVSDKPLHSEIKLPGSANAFYERAVNQHLRIGIAALDLLRSQLNSLHSRKLRSFDEPPFR